jgi:TPR repeat protein
VKLAESLEKGVGAPKNLGRAMTLYTQGCDQGSAVSCTDLGTMHYQGEGAEKNPELGVKFLSRGCEAGDAKGCLALSTAYRDGVGLGKNPNRAFTFADRACTMGSPEGCVRVALAMIAGAGVTKDVKGGLGKLDMLCASRGVFACENLAQLYTSGAGSAFRRIRCSGSSTRRKRAPPGRRPTARSTSCSAHLTRQGVPRLAATRCFSPSATLGTRWHAGCSGRIYSEG